MTVSIKLPKKLGPPAASILLDDLRNHHGDVRLDATELVQISTFGLQVLIASARQAEADGAFFEMSALSPTVRTQFQILGIDPDSMRECVA